MLNLGGVPREKGGLVQVNEGSGREIAARPFRILVVDDNELLAESLARFLARRGCSVRTAESPEEAEIASREEPFDCGIFDIHLGWRDGIVLAARMLRTRRVLSAIFFSATADRFEQTRASALGIFVRKDVSLEELDRAVRELVAQTRQ